MTERVFVHKGSYHDSALLMRMARDLSRLDGVEEAVVLMGTEMNLSLLAEAGFADPDLEQATPMDLVVAIRAKDEDTIGAATRELDRLMAQATAGNMTEGGIQIFSSLPEAVSAQPGINLVSVAVPGQYAGYVAGQALDAEKHVFLFSDNVAVEEERELKRRGLDAGLLVMGPDCGTSILAGVGLGFANRVRRGAIGLVGASGTGIQEISSQVHRMGQGVSQAIGTGSRDLSGEVGGLMTGFGLQLLAEDETTEVIVLVAKHPDEAVARRMEEILAAIAKPAVVRYLGQPARPSVDGVTYASDLDEAACAAVSALPGTPPAEALCTLDADARALLAGGRKLAGRLIGLFGGGSLASEAALILGQSGLRVTVPDHPLDTSNGVEGQGHLVVDVGDDFYTVGKPHPMVDQTVRLELMEAAVRDPGVGLLLFDLVLGDGSHPDPASEIAEALTRARSLRAEDSIRIVASVTGTELDPQEIGRQMRTLTDAGVVVQVSATRAAKLAASVLEGGTP